MVKVIIGCPVWRRAWVINHWLEYIEKQDFPLSDLGFVFELGEDDEETHDKLWAWHSQHPEVSIFDGVVRADVRHKQHPSRGRKWLRADYWKMVNMRNALLDRVRAYQPDRYFSLDSDILLEDPSTISILYELTKQWDAVGTLSYMTPEGTDYPSAMTWRNKPGGPAYRADYPIGNVFNADVIMASKMMSRKTYESSYYIWHKQGEDLGWSSICAQKNLRLACASNLYTAHIMYEGALENYLKNGDPRSTNKLD